MAEDKKSPSTTASVSGDECGGTTSVGEGSEGSADSGGRSLPSKAPVSGWWWRYLCFFPDELRLYMYLLYISLYIFRFSYSLPVLPFVATIYVR